MATEYKEKTTTTTYVAAPQSGLVDVSVVGSASTSGDLKNTAGAAASQVGQAARVDAADLKATVGSAASQVRMFGKMFAPQISHLETCMLRYSSACRHFLNNSPSHTGW